MTAFTAPAYPEHTRWELFRLIGAASIGNALEWFDLLIYGYFAVTCRAQGVNDGLDPYAVTEIGPAAIGRVYGRPLSGP